MGRRPSERALPRHLSGQLRLGIIKGSGQDVGFRDRSIRPALSLLGGPNNDNPNTFSKLGMCSDLSFLLRIFCEKLEQEFPVLALLSTTLYNFYGTKQQKVSLNI